ncbi:MAG: hypothetical protein ACRCV5_19665 [Afipia sp.]
MKQRAVKFGVLANPYRAVEPGEEFDYPERMNWAVPVSGEPEAKTPAPEPVKSGRKRKVAPDAAAAGDDDLI